MTENPLRPRYQRDEPQSRGPSRRFFRTVSGPGATAYPADPATVYYVEWLRNISYTETPGNQSLASTPSNNFGYVFNLETANYIEEGNVGLAFKHGQWYTIDKVVAFDLLFVGTGESVPGGITLHAVNTSDDSLAWSKAFPLGGTQTTVGTSCDEEGNVWAATKRQDGLTRLSRFDRDGGLLTEFDGASGILDRGLCVDAAGNLFATIFNGVQFLSKYDATGTFQYSVSLGGLGNGGGPPAVDNAGRVFIPRTPANNTIKLVSVYDAADGSFLFDVNNNTAALDAEVGARVAIDNEGNILCHVTERPNGKGVQPTNFYLKKFDSAGSHIWTTSIPGNANASDVATDPTGNVLVATATGTHKFAADGTLLWSDAFASIAVTVDTGGTIYAAVTTPPGTIRKLDASGNLLTQSRQGIAPIVDLVVIPGRVPIFQ